MSDLDSSQLEMSEFNSSQLEMTPQEICCESSQLEMSEHDSSQVETSDFCCELSQPEMSHVHSQVEMRNGSHLGLRSEALKSIAISL